MINGFSEYGRLEAIVSWILIFAIYFVPYTLMVEELGSTSKHAGGGVSFWIHETTGPRMAYHAGWTYWAVHMSYISQKPNSAVATASWTLFQDRKASGMNTTVMQLICLMIFLFVMHLFNKRISVLERLSTLVGSAMFIMSMLFIVMMVAVPALTADAFMPAEWSVRTLMPTFDMSFSMGLSILVFAVGGCEEVSPCVNKVGDPARDFSKGVAALTLTVVVTAVLETITLGMMFDSNHIPGDLMTNGAYRAFQKLGEYYYMGNFFMVAYALTDLIGQSPVMVLSVDVPLRMPLDSADSRFIPSKTFEKNEHGTCVNGHRPVLLIVCVLIVVPAFGIKNVDVLMCWLVKIDSVCMPLHYLWVFVTYIVLKKTGDKFQAECCFLKRRIPGILVGTRCLIFTVFACITSIYSEDPFQLVPNTIMPFVLMGLNFILPWMAEREKKT